MARAFEYFVVCGLGPDLRTMEGRSGFHGFDYLYMPSLLDQFPPTASSGVAELPPQLPPCVMPAGVEFYSSGPIMGDDSSQPRSYPIILTDGDGSKIYVSCVAFRDPVDDDVAQAYRIPSNTYVDKCICIVSHTPCFQVFRETLEELHRLCFSSSGSRLFIDSPCIERAYMVERSPWRTAFLQNMFFILCTCDIGLKMLLCIVDRNSKDEVSSNKWSMMFLADLNYVYKAQHVLVKLVILQLFYTSWWI